jgi:ribosomal protein S4E
MNPNTTEKINEIPEFQYRVELTRVHNKRLPPAGKIFLVAHVKHRTKLRFDTYSKAFPVLIGTPEDQLNEMSQKMIDQIKKQYSL